MKKIIKKKSFTLIELIVVIAIIAVLAAIIAINAFKAIEKTKVSKLTADIKVLKTAALAYYSDVGMWPPDVFPSEDPGFVNRDYYKTQPCRLNPPGIDEAIERGWNGPYLEKYPAFTPWGGHYDWEYWPVSFAGLPPGCYVSAKPKWDLSTCTVAPNPDSTAVPDVTEIKLQQQGIDVHHPAGVDIPSDNVIVLITNF
jgi:prepilin-type N-terminal cleavage/methylation domain-containing protein